MSGRTSVQETDQHHGRPDGRPDERLRVLLASYVALQMSNQPIKTNSGGQEHWFRIPASREKTPRLVSSRLVSSRLVIGKSSIAVSGHSAIGTVMTISMCKDVEVPSCEVIAEYIWVGANGSVLRSKTKTLSGPVGSPTELPKSSYYEASRGEAPGSDTEVILHPRVIFRDPFRREPHILVLCDTYTRQGDAIPSNSRAKAMEVFSQKEVKDEESRYVIEQMYTFSQNLMQRGLDWVLQFYHPPQGPSYCGIGADKARARSIAEAHYQACIYAGIKIGGINGEVMPGQWTFEVGPCAGIEAADQLIIARYILERQAEIENAFVSFERNAILKGGWNIAGAPIKYSTKSMEGEGGAEKIKEAIRKLRMRREEHIAAHGEGYFEDRRLSGNGDPYIVTSMFAETTLLWKPSDNLLTDGMIYDRIEETLQYN